MGASDDGKGGRTEREGPDAWAWHGPDMAWKIEVARSAFGFVWFGASYIVGPDPCLVVINIVMLRISRAGASRVRPCAD